MLVVADGVAQESDAFTWRPKRSDRGDFVGAGSGEKAKKSRVG